MVQKQNIKAINNKTSQLERFSLGFEYDKTLQQVKHDIRIRTFE